jgi:hypothetical protein
MADPMATPAAQESESPKVETAEASQIADVLRAASDAVDWYDAVGPAEALTWVVAARDALHHTPRLGGLDISTATKH